MRMASGLDCAAVQLSVVSRFSSCAASRLNISSRRCVFPARRCSQAGICDAAPDRCHEALHWNVPILIVCRTHSRTSRRTALWTSPSSKPPATRWAGLRSDGQAALLLCFTACRASGRPTCDGGSAGRHGTAMPRHSHVQAPQHLQPVLRSDTLSDIVVRYSGSRWRTSAARASSRRRSMRRCWMAALTLPCTP
jgi:hypothetical protein